MDWHSWLSRSNLEPSLANEFGWVFCRNDLQKEDIIYFNHEFLQSLGISVAKHRLEILKLVKKELGRPPKSRKVGKFIFTLKKTKKFFTKLVFFKNFNNSMKTSGKLRRLNSAKEQKVPKSPITCRTVAKSGPIDRGMIEQMEITDKRSINLSGPLDMKFYQQMGLMSANRPREKYGITDGKRRKTLDDGSNALCSYRPCQGKSPSPLFNHYLGDGDYSPWSLMFQDLKPT